VKFLTFIKNPSEEGFAFPTFNEKPLKNSHLKPKIKVFTVIYVVQALLASPFRLKNHAESAICNIS